MTFPICTVPCIHSDSSAATAHNFVFCWVLFSVSVSLCFGQGSEQGAGYEKAEAEGVETELCVPKGKRQKRWDYFQSKGVARVTQEKTVASVPPQVSTVPTVKTQTQIPTQAGELALHHLPTHCQG